MVKLASLAVCVAMGFGVSTHAQLKRPKADLTPVIVSETLHAGSTARLALKVVLPDDIHVQSDKPRDPALIPTVLTLEPPPGVTVDAITYPPASTLEQQGQQEPLDVFDHTFTIDVRVALDAGLPPGAVVLKGRLRYQACDATACYPPARADVEWTLPVSAGGVR